MKEESMKTKILETLFLMQDYKYKMFQAKLIPTVNPDRIIGVRTPDIRKYARKLRNTEEATVFLKTLPHQYYEENNLHACLIEQIQDFDECIEQLNCFLPYVDNWSTCDMLRPKCLKKKMDGLLSAIEAWMNSDDSYTVRFGIEMLMVFFLDERFEPEFLERVAAVNREEYYIRMMIAWYFATALAKQYESAVKIIEAGKLPVWTHNKAIQKAVESYRISDERKKYLRMLKVIDFHVT